MRGRLNKLLRIVLLASLAAIVAIPPAFACGDKFLVNSRGVKADQIYAAMSPGSVLIFRNPVSDLAKVALGAQVESDLVKAGHVVTVVENQEKLEEALKSQSYDVVMCVGDDAQGIKTQIDNLAHKPRMLPVVGQISKDEMKSMRQQYGNAIKSPVHSSTVCLMVAEAVRKSREANPKS